MYVSALGRPARHSLATRRLVLTIRTVKGPSELKLSITISPSKSVLELKEEIAAKSEVEKERQRLIYSGTPCLLTIAQRQRRD